MTRLWERYRDADGSWCPEFLAFDEALVERCERYTWDDIATALATGETVEETAERLLADDAINDAFAKLRRDDHNRRLQKTV